MSHPDALLAEYVDGALAEGERTAVERHLGSCERCRDEVALARAGRAALASVTETPAPSDLGAPAIAEAKRRAGSHPAAGEPPGRPTWYRWAGAAAGIAAALLVVALVLPHVGNAPATTAAAGDAAAPRAAASPATSVETQNVNYDLAGVESLATSSRGQEGAAFGSNGQPTQVPVAASATPEERIPFADAVACLDRAFTEPTGHQSPDGQLVRVIQARFRGVPAVLGVYLLSPGAGQPADIVRVLVASSRDCSILTTTQATT
jgi:putative zinc finger protein